MSERSSWSRASHSFSGRAPGQQRADQAVEVGTGREVAAGAGHDGDPQLRVGVEVVPDVGQPHEHLGVEGVLLLRTVEGDLEDVTAALGEDRGSVERGRRI